MKKIGLVLVVFGFCLVVGYVTQGATFTETSKPFKITATTLDGTNSKADASVMPSNSGTTRFSNGSIEPTKGITNDSDARKIDTDFQAAKEKCNEIVAEDSKTKCMNEAYSKYSNELP